jgi:hypothetical protein
MMQKTGKAGPEFRYMDRPEVRETFADSLHMMFFDGNALRIELTANWLDRPKGGGTKATGSARTACRLVLTPECADVLLRQLNGLGATIAAAQAQQDKTSQTMQ